MATSNTRNCCQEAIGNRKAEGCGDNMTAKPTKLNES